MADQLSPSDRSSLAAERGSVNMAIAGVIVLERGPGVTYDALCTRIAERIHLLPRYRQRLEQPAMGLANPVWVDDEHFDVHWHVRQTTLPAPGGEAELAAYVGREASRRMDRSRPLWELHLIEGLEGDRVAVMPKMHHALLDGMAAIGVGMILLDPGPEPLPVDPPPEDWEPEPFALRNHLMRVATSPISRAQRLALDATARAFEATPRSTATDLLRATELVTELARARPAAPMLPLNRPISPNRSYAMVHAPLADLKAAAKAAGGTVNDAVLAAVVGMLAGYLDDAGIAVEDLRREPAALVPVSVRDEGETATGNRISIVFVDLPVGEPDPARRIAAVHERMEAIKGSSKVAAGSLMLNVAGFAPPLFSSVLARATGDQLAFNLVVSNVPGPQLPFYLNGSRVLAVYPVVPLNPASQGLSVGVFSYDGSLCFGLLADRDLDPPVERAAAALEAAIGELVATT